MDINEDKWVVCFALPLKYLNWKYEENSWKRNKMVEFEIWQPEVSGQHV